MWSLCKRRGRHVARLCCHGRHQKNARTGRFYSMTPLRQFKGLCLVRMAEGKQLGQPPIGTYRFTYTTFSALVPILRPGMSPLLDNSAVLTLPRCQLRLTNCRAFRMRDASSTWFTTSRSSSKVVYHFASEPCSSRSRLQAQAQAITCSLLRIDSSIIPDFRWDEKIHGTAGTFVINDHGRGTRGRRS
jgi:hypothetical protein